MEIWTKHGRSEVNMRTFKFDDLQIGDAWISGTIDFEAISGASARNESPEFDQDDVLTLDWMTFEITSFDSDFISRQDLPKEINDTLTNLYGRCAICGYGSTKFILEMRERIESYCDEKHLWE